jgi:uncharacterized membrane-anchored protein YhcB (DUF1043 family)
MTEGDIAAWVAAAGASIGSIGGWLLCYVRNTKSQAKWAGKVETALEDVRDEVRAGRDTVERHVQHCPLVPRVENLETDVRDMRKRSDRRTHAREQD